MKPGKPSETALRIALNRIAAARNPLLRELVADVDEPYSEWFVRAHSVRARLQLALWSWAPTRRALYRMTEALSAGLPVQLLLRKRFLLDAVREAVGHGVRQVVVLGAGLDPLGLLIAREFPEVRTFEIDHPDTQAIKRGVLLQRNALLPGLTLIPADLSERSLAAALHPDTGYRASEPSVVVAEGLLMYLTEEAVDDLCAQLRLQMPEGSWFLFSVVDRDALADPESGVARTARFLESTAEPFRSSMDRKGLDRLLARHGFERKKLAGHRQLRATYLAESQRGLPAFEGELLVVAEAVRLPRGKNAPGGGKR